jgi:hypothetical protein
VTLGDDEMLQCKKAAEQIIANEFPALPTKLLMASERLYDQYDRLTSEAALRLNLAPPLAVFVVVAAAKTAWPLVACLVVPVLLVLQARLRARAANDLLVQSIIAGVVRSAEVSEATRWILSNRSSAAALPARYGS